MSEIKTKVCPNCKIEKNYSEFYKNKARADNHESLCKICSRQKTIAYKTTDRYREQLEEYNQREEVKSKVKEIYYAKKELILSGNFEYTIVDEKLCSKCKTKKKIEEFSKSYKSNDGHKSRCKTCSAVEMLIYNSREEVKQRKKDWEKTDRGILAKERQKERQPEFGKKYRENNRAKLTAKQSRRKAQKIRATPTWFIQEKENVDFIYGVARELTIKIGKEYHVDHIVPLKSDFVCGLHTLANLQILPGSVNCSKSNRYWPDMA